MKTMVDHTQDDGAVGVEAFADDLDEVHEPPARPRRRRQAAESTSGNRQEHDSGPARDSSGRRRSGPSRTNLVLVALLAAAIVIIVQQLGAAPPSSTTATGRPTASAMPQGMSTRPPLDEARAAELKKKAEADPADLDTRQQLGELYISAGLYQDAIEPLEQVLKAQPDHLDALLAIGVAKFNTGQDAPAEQHWLRATEAAPDRPEPWYNLGFLYMSRNPADRAGAQKAWDKVVEISPDSELAKTATAHLKQVTGPNTSPSPAG